MAVLVRKMLQLGVHLLSSFPGEVQDVVLILQRVQPGLSQASALKVLVFVVQKGITCLAARGLICKEGPAHSPGGHMTHGPSTSHGAGQGCSW